MSSFPGGLYVCRRFWGNVVKPLLLERFADLHPAAALVGGGSEVLGFDTERSTDHEWVPRVLLLCSTDEATRLAGFVDRYLSDSLPRSFLGFSTHFGPADEVGIRVAQTHTQGPIRHGVRLIGLREWVIGELGFDPREGMSAYQWLGCPQQRLLSVTAGAVFDDPLGELTKVRALLAYYPHDVWLTMMAAQWSRIAEVEPFVGRCIEVGDLRGARLIASQIVEDAMRLAFLQERRYWPYQKWFGSAFQRLALAKELSPRIDSVLDASDGDALATAVGRLLLCAARNHNSLSVTQMIAEELTKFYSRPFQVIHAEHFAAALQGSVDDPLLRQRCEAGSINQFVDNTSILTQPRIGRAVSDCLSQSE
jgi:Domain of unknown function (DUF4037)